MLSSLRPPPPSLTSTPMKPPLFPVLPTSQRPSLSTSPHAHLHVYLHPLNGLPLLPPVGLGTLKSLPPTYAMSSTYGSFTMIPPSLHSASSTSSPSLPGPSCRIPTSLLSMRTLSPSYPTTSPRHTQLLVTSTKLAHDPQPPPPPLRPLHVLEALPLPQSSSCSTMAKIA